MKKIWLWVFMIMFLLPEIFWSPILNTVDGILQNNNITNFIRPSFFTISDNRDILIFILLIQIIGIFGTLVQVHKLNLNRLLKLLIYIILGIILILTIFIFYILFSTRHGIGF